MIEQEIDFNIPLKHLDTKDEEGATLPGSVPKLIGDILLNPSFKEESSVRKLLLAQKIAKDEKVTMSKVDFDLVLKAIKQAGNMIAPLIERQILLVLENTKWD